MQKVLAGLDVSQVSVGCDLYIIWILDRCWLDFRSMLIRFGLYAKSMLLGAWLDVSWLLDMC